MDLAPLVAGMFVPLHDGHQVKQDNHTGEYKPQCDIAFAARAVGIVIFHDQSASGAIPASFSTIRAANSAVMQSSDTPNRRWAAGSLTSFFSREVAMASHRNHSPIPAEAARYRGPPTCSIAGRTPSGTSTSVYSRIWKRVCGLPLTTGSIGTPARA